MTQIAEFTGIDKVKYKVPINFEGEEAYVFDLGMQLAKYYLKDGLNRQYRKIDFNQASPSEVLESISYMESAWRAFSHFFFKAYPDHALTKYFDPIEGLNDAGRAAMSRLIGGTKAEQYQVTLIPLLHALQEETLQPQEKKAALKAPKAKAKK